MLRHAVVFRSVLTGGVVQFLNSHFGKVPWKVDCPAVMFTNRWSHLRRKQPTPCFSNHQLPAGVRIPVVVLYTHLYVVLAGAAAYLLHVTAHVRPGATLRQTVVL
jgi:hypothetical protein